MTSIMEHKTISVQELRKLLPCRDEFILDPRYLLPADAEVWAAVQEFISRRGAFDYVPSYHDCDNAAAEMMVSMSGRGWPFGMAIVLGHAVCVYVNDRREPVYIEPQDGSVIAGPETLIAVIMI